MAGKFYKTFVTVEVLTDAPFDPQELMDVVRTIEGDGSGKWSATESKELSKREMALALQAQNSDPDFLLGEDGWKYALHDGDEVTIDPKDGEEPYLVTISTIEYVAGDLVRIVDIDGERYECAIKDFS